MSPTDNMHGVILETDLPGIPLVRRGKVRDLYDLGEHFLIVATDRISAFDVVLPVGIPDKGKVLTQLTSFWFNVLKVPNHLVTDKVKEMPPELHPFEDQLRDRSMLVEKLDMFPVECPVRGYLAGSGWVDYKKTGAVCGIVLPKGLQESSRLPEAVFTPSTKADEGHDENIPLSEVAKLVGQERAEELEVLAADLRSQKDEAERAREDAGDEAKAGMRRQMTALQEERVNLIRQLESESIAGASYKQCAC